MYIANLVSCWACRAKERDDMSVGILELSHDSGEPNVDRTCGGTLTKMSRELLLGIQR